MAPRGSRRPALPHLPTTLASVAAALVLALIAGSSAVAAHAIIVASKPAVNEPLAGPDIQIRLQFNSRIDKKRSRLTLTQPDKSAQPLAIIDGDEPNVVTATALGLTAGDYTLRWQVLSFDGHITRGDIPFRVVTP